MKRLSELDGIRGLAVAAVIAHHFVPVVGLGIGRNLFFLALYRFVHPGWLGVDIFFVLSGFLITGIIVKERNERNFWSNFYLRRAFRILPAFFAVFIITLAAAHFFAPDIPIRLNYVLPAIFFMANWTVVGLHEMPMLTHLWSLAVEEQFYFLWPQAAKRMSNSLLFKLALWLAVGSVLCRFVLALFHTNPYVLYKITPPRIDGLCLGAALAIGLNLPGVRHFLERWWRTIALVAFLLLPAAFLALHGSLFVFNPWSQVLAIPPAEVLTAMLIYGAVESKLPAGLKLFFGNPVMTYLGRRSYALYLIHDPVQVAVELSRAHGYLAKLPQGIGMNLLLIASTIALSLVLTELSWRVIESPAQELRRRLMRNREDGTGQHPTEEMLITQLAREDQAMPEAIQTPPLKGAIISTVDK